MRSGPVAGRNAIAEVNQQREREERLNDFEARLVAKEMELNGRLTTADTTSKLEAKLRSVIEVRGDSRHT